MIALNLLSVEQKERLASQHRQRLFLQAIIVLMVGLAVSGGVLAGVWMYLQQRLTTVNDQLTIVRGDTKKFPFAAATQQATARTTLLTEALRNGRQLLTTATSLLAALPTDVTLTKFTYRDSGREVTLQGVAADRTAFATLKANLEQLSFVAAVESPVSSLARRQSIEFTLQAKLKPETTP